RDFSRLLSPLVRSVSFSQSALHPPQPHSFPTRRSSDLPPAPHGGSTTGKEETQPRRRTRMTTYTATLKPTKGFYFHVKDGTESYSTYPYKVYISAPHTPKEDEEVLDTYYRTDSMPNLDKVG